MNTEEISEQFLIDEKKIKHLEEIGFKGLNHLIEYLKHKDDPDFVSLALDIHKLLQALYHLSNNDSKYLDVLGLKNAEEITDSVSDTIKKLDEQIVKDITAIKEKKEKSINLNLLLTEVRQFKTDIDNFLKIRLKS